MGPIVGLLILLILVAIFNGFGAAWEIVCNLFIGLLDFIKGLPGLINALWPILGIEDMIASFSVFGGIIMLLSLFGIVLSIWQKKKLWTIICSCVEVVSTLLTIASVMKG